MHTSVVLDRVLRNNVLFIFQQSQLCWTLLVLYTSLSTFVRLRPRDVVHNFSLFKCYFGTGEHPMKERCLLIDMYRTMRHSAYQPSCNKIPRSTAEYLHNRPTGCRIHSQPCTIHFQALRFASYTFSRQVLLLKTTWLVQMLAGPHLDATAMSRWVW